MSAVSRSQGLSRGADHVTPPECQLTREGFIVAGHFVGQFRYDRDERSRRIGDVSDGISLRVIRR